MAPHLSEMQIHLFVGIASITGESSVYVPIALFISSLGSSAVAGVNHLFGNTFANTTRMEPVFAAFTLDERKIFVLLTYAIQLGRPIHHRPTRSVDLINHAPERLLVMWILQDFDISTDIAQFYPFPAIGQVQLIARSGPARTVV